jgi:XTP/dITP diphosphohydrolase
MTELWIATGNQRKRLELARLLEGSGYRLRLQTEAPGAPEVVEDRPDFAGNANKKAVTLAKFVHSPAMADDSGLCIDALDGQPGVLSARYAGEGATDTDRIAAVLDELRDVPDDLRTARFVCNVCLVDGRGTTLATFEETCAGRISRDPSGTAGFGYDPIFIPSQYRNDQLSFAQLSPAQKDAISHRGRALRSLVHWLTENELT